MDIIIHNIVISQALEHKLQEKQEHVQMIQYSSFKFLQYTIPLQLSMLEDSHCTTIEPVSGEVRLYVQVHA